MTILLLAVSKQLSSSQQAIFQIKQTTDTNNKQQTKFGHFELLSAVKNETTCNEMQYFIYYINIPYGQSSAKLPVILSLSHPVIILQSHQVIIALFSTLRLSNELTHEQH